jgi:hypothetical protein
MSLDLVGDYRPWMRIFLRVYPINITEPPQDLSWAGTVTLFIFKTLISFTHLLQACLLWIGAGLLYSHHFHYQVTPTVIDNEESGGHPDESATETYTRILLKRRIGYPLWMPEPHNLPPEYEALGIRIGDVGIVNENGLFRIFVQYLPTSR